MNKLMNFLVVCIVVDLCFSNYAFAQNFKKLDGSYAIASKTILDPPPDEKKDRVLLFIKGRGARDIYEGIPGPGKKDVCGDNVFRKSAGDLECTKDVKLGEYVCGIGILLQTGATAPGLGC